jgi:hypothetical protein
LAFYEGRAATDAIPMRLGDLRGMVSILERAAAARRPATVREIAAAERRITELVECGAVASVVSMLLGDQVRQLATDLHAGREPLPATSAPSPARAVA